MSKLPLMVVPSKSAIVVNKYIWNLSKNLLVTIINQIDIWTTQRQVAKDNCYTIFYITNSMGMIKIFV